MVDQSVFSDEKCRGTRDNVFIYSQTSSNPYPSVEAKKYGLWSIVTNTTPKLNEEQGEGDDDGGGNDDEPRRDSGRQRSSDGDASRSDDEDGGDDDGRE